MDLNFLDFEQPIAELEAKIEELRHLSGGGSLDIVSEVGRLQARMDRELKQTYGKLTAWQKVPGSAVPSSRLLVNE